MTKRLISFFIVLAMVASFVPVLSVGISAEGLPGPDALKDHTDHEGWTKWTDATKLPTEAGNYYLDVDVNLSGAAWTVNSDIKLCLNGHHVKQTTANQRVIDLNKSLTVFDCTASYDAAGNYKSGTITGGSRTYGAGVSVRVNAVLNLYGGAITGNANTASEGYGGGVYLSQNKSNTQAGGVFNMYGGEVSGNTAQYGGGVYVPGHNTSSTYTSKAAAVNIYGGKLRNNIATQNGGAICQRFKPSTVAVTIENAEISGNQAQSTASGKGCGGAIYMEVGGSLTIKDSVIKENISSNGAIYAQGGAPVKLENVRVIDNEANTTGTAGIYIAGSSSTLTVSGLVVVDGNENNNMYFNNASSKPLYVNELAAGSKLQYNTNSKVNTDDKVATVIALASGGKQSAWEDISIVCNGEEVNYTSSGFKFGHYHGDQKYTAWESGSTLPSNGYNFLTQDVLRTKEANMAGDSHICLNGHDITISPDATDTLRMMAVPGKVTIEDCTAHYDENGKYISGALTGGNRTYGAAVAVRQGGVFTLESGAIRNNANSDEGGAVYINGNSATKDGGKFIMNGGEITGNTTKRGAIAIAAGVVSDATTPGTFIMNGGKIYGNTGDGIYTWANTDVQVLGGTVEDRIYTRCDLTIGEAELKNVYLVGDTIFKVANAKGAKVSFSAEKGGRYVSDALTDTTSTFTYQKDDFKLTTQEGKLYLAPAHEHCVEGETGCGHSQLGWNAWTDATKLPSEGNYYLETDVELTATAELKNLNLCLNGHTISNVAENTRVLNVASGTVTLTDCAKDPGMVTGGNRDYGAGITISNGTTLNLYNIKISGNENKTDGGALYIRGGGTVNMFSGEISGNKSRTGAAVCIADKASKPGVFNLYGGTITGNSATGNGGALFGYVGAQFNLAGGTITGNTANHGGAFYFGASMDKITVSGNVQITGNTTHAGKNDDIYLPVGKIITVGALNGAKIGVMNDGSYAQITDQEAQGFESNRSSRVVVAKDGALWLDNAEDHTHCLCDGALGGCDHQDVKWMSWDESDSLPASGNYYLTCDVTLKTTAELQQDLQLCLNGHTVKIAWQEGQETRRLIGLAAGKELSITDCQGTGLLTGGNRDYGSAISIRDNAVLNLYGGRISGNSNNHDGAVYIARGTFNMYGGEISGNYSYAGAVCLAETKNNVTSVANLYGGIITDNEAIRGGGVYAYDGAVVNVAGTKVNGNRATKYGGGIYLKSGCTFTITGGSVDNNQAAEFGGGVYAGRGDTILEGGSISGNRGGKDGGGMYSVAGFITLSGTTIANNFSGGAGGGICLVVNVTAAGEVLKGTFDMTGGLFTGNESTNSGGGAYIRVAEVKATGGKVTGNKANGNGGGFYFAGANATLQNVEITKNTSVNDSGAVGAGQSAFTVSGEKQTYQAKVTIGDGAKLNNNKAKNGGAMSIYHSTQLTVEGGQVNNNYASNMGGGIIVGKPGIFQMTGGSVSGNRAEKSSGGGLYVAGSASVQIKGGNITNNWCKKYGAGVYVNKCTVNIYGGYIGGNYSDESGSGISSSASGIVNLYGGTVANNTARSSAGGILIQSKSVLNMYGGTVSGNKVPANGAGIYISTNSFINMSGGKVIGNSNERYGSALYAGKATTKITGGTFEDNYSEKGGTVYLTGNNNAELSNLTVRGNKANNSGGGVVFSRSTGFLKDSLIEENEALAGAGLLVQMENVVNVDSKVVCENVILRNNKATTLSGGAVYIFRQVDVTMRDCEMTGNTAAEDGGAIYMNCGQSLLDYRSYLTLENCKIEGNTAGRQGGGAFVNNMMYLNLENSKVLNNTAAQEGGAVYGAKGSHLTITDSLISGNESGKTGAAVYGGYDVNLLGGTITDNKAAEGAAVYLAPGMFDGHSYTNGKVKLAGNLIIKDNDCPQANLYIDEGRVCGTTAEGFGEDTEIHVVLHSGLITTTLIAAYDYEGGDCKYIVTYGDKSMTEIEPGAEDLVAKPLETQTTAAPVEPKDNSLLLYAGIGVIALLAVAGVVLVILKKKKSPAGEAK